MAATSKTPTYLESLSAQAPNGIENGITYESSFLDTPVNSPQSEASVLSLISEGHNCEESSSCRVQDVQSESISLDTSLAVPAASERLEEISSNSRPSLKRAITLPVSSEKPELRSEAEINHDGRSETDSISVTLSAAYELVERQLEMLNIRELEPASSEQWRVNPEADLRSVGSFGVRPPTAERHKALSVILERLDKEMERDRHTPMWSTSEPVPAQQQEIRRSQRVPSLRGSFSDPVHLRHLRVPTDLLSTSSHSEQSTEWMTIVSMAISASDGSSLFRLGMLDTASAVNAIAEEVVSDIGMEMESYDGPDICALGVYATPIGTVKVQWHVAGRAKTYTTSFRVFPDELARGFDVLLGGSFIKKHKFLLRNEDVFFIELAS